MKMCVIYVPGLGDRFDALRQKCLKRWNIATLFVPMNWEGEKAYEPKYQRLESAIAAASRRKEKVVLVGESAGSTMVLAAAAKYDVPVLTICGVNNPTMHILPNTYRRAPAFRKAFQTLGRSFQTLNLLNVHTVTPLFDGVVSPRHAKISGASNHLLFSVGHFFTIALCLTVLQGRILRIIKDSL